ncbi:MAG: hypothetical protein ACJA08_002975 [Cyclobacteriaceae bacterium]|jgi:hypothetical protein
MKVSKIFTCLFVISLFVACDNEEKQPTLIDGTYEGVFGRSSPGAKYASSQVTLTFANGEFNGDSEIEKYPAICNGTYNIEGNSVEFSNFCIWTAEFDWSYILAGEFEIKVASNVIELIQTNGGTTDRYQLKRK